MPTTYMERHPIHSLTVISSFSSRVDVSNFMTAAPLRQRMTSRPRIPGTMANAKRGIARISGTQMAADS